MASVFVGQLLLVPYTFAPKGFAFCAGQLLPISQNTALFSLLGVQFGGDGRVTFALPNLQGRVPIGQGQGPGLQDYVMGQQAGESSVTLLLTETPMHSHSVFESSSPIPGPVGTPTNNSPGQPAAGTNIYVAGNQNVQMNAGCLPPFPGGNQPHNNMMPTLTLNWIIALQGVFPARG